MTIQLITPEEAAAVSGGTHFRYAYIAFSAIPRSDALPALPDLPLLGRGVTPLYSIFGAIYDAVIDGVLAAAEAVADAADAVFPIP